MPISNDLKVNHVIIEAKKEIDYLFILAHDGIEYIDVPLPETIARYHDFIDFGADAVIGTHPHCPQGWEEYKGKPIFYSLGNFFFNSKETPEYRAWNRPHWYESLCVVLKINNKGITYEVYNLKNEDNINIVLDKSDNIKKHNQTIRQYLIDKPEYEKYLDRELNKIVDNQHLPTLFTAIEFYFQRASVKTSIKLILKQILSLISSINKNKKLIKDKRLIFLIKNDTRRSALLRVLNRFK